MNEIWKDIKGYEGLYQISNHGDVRSLDRIVCQKNKFGGLSRHIYKGRTLRQRTTNMGYAYVNLSKNGCPHRFMIHRLVADHFLQRPEEKDCVNHKDSDKSNNSADNLEWCTQSENIKYAYDNGRKHPPHERKVGQYDDEGNLIRVWRSQSEAARVLNIYQGNIYKVCVGKRNQTGGFIWKYID